MWPTSHPQHKKKKQKHVSSSQQRGAWLIIIKRKKRRKNSLSKTKVSVFCSRDVNTEIPNKRVNIVLLEVKRFCRTKKLLFSVSYLKLQFWKKNTKQTVNEKFQHIKMVSVEGWLDYTGCNRLENRIQWGINPGCEACQDCNLKLKILGAPKSYQTSCDLLEMLWRDASGVLKWMLLMWKGFR